MPKQKREIKNVASKKMRRYKPNPTVKVPYDYVLL